jgi:hypothetical protein
MAKRALLIGINYVSQPDHALDGCIHDVLNMRDLLVSQFGYMDTDIQILRDDVDDPSTMPTQNNIIYRLYALAAHSAVMSEVWVHYSGHGSRFHEESSIVPIDFDESGGLSGHVLRHIFGLFRCPLRIIFDSCHSGTICKLPWTVEYKGAGLYLYSHCLEDVENSMGHNENIVIYSGCRDDQSCFDEFDVSENKVVGTFTEAFIHCSMRYLKTPQRDKYNEQSQPSWSDILFYYTICEHISSNNSNQIPILSYIL